MAIDHTTRIKFLLPWKPGLSTDQIQQIRLERRSHSPRITHLKHKNTALSRLKSQLKSLKPRAVVKCTDHTGRALATRNCAYMLTF